jgi:RNA polymerase sigma factor (sigma-70 family)
MKEDQIIQLLLQDKIDKAFVKLYAMYPQIRNLLKKYGANRDEVQDIFQDALVVLYQKLKQENFSIQTSLQAYITNTCKYMYLHKQKRAGKQVELMEIPVDETELTYWINQEKNMSQAEAALMQIGERCREILLLFYMQGKTMAEIARQYAYSSEHVAKTQKYKCLEAARNTYKKLLHS